MLWVGELGPWHIQLEVGSEKDPGELSGGGGSQGELKGGGLEWTEVAEERTCSRKAELEREVSCTGTDGCAMGGGGKGGRRCGDMWVRIGSR